MTITLGEIITAVVFLGGVAATLIAMKVDIAVLKSDLRALRDLVVPVRTWFDEAVGPTRYKTDGELLHERAGIDHLLGLREAVRKKDVETR